MKTLFQSIHGSVQQDDNGHVWVSGDEHKLCVALAIELHKCRERMEVAEEAIAELESENRNTPSR